MTDFTLTPGSDNFTGEDTENNTVFGAADDLTSADTLVGSGTNGVRDELRFTAPGNVSALDLSGVSNFERIDLAVGGISVELTDAVATGTQSSEFGVGGSSGDDVFDFSAVVTTTAAIRVALRAGTDTLIGGAGSETLQVKQGDLDASDSIDVGAGFDVLALLDDVTIAQADIANVSGFERVAFGGDGTITVDDAFVASGPFTFSNFISNIDSDQTVDASAVTSQTLVFQTRAGDDTLIGGGGKNTFDFVVGELDANDTVNGSAGSRDTLVLRGDGNVAAADLANVTDIENIRLVATASATIELSDALAVNNRIQVVSRSGDNTIDASNVSAIARVFLGSGDATFAGGTGNDNVLVAGDDLTAADTLDGADGTDTLTITKSGDVDAADLANVTNFEQLALRQGGSVTLADGVATGSTFRVFGSGATDVVDGSAETDARILFRNVDVNDDLTGGALDDRFDLQSQDFAAIDGGAGDLNSIVLDASTASLDLTDPALATRISNIQVIDLNNAEADVRLDSAAIAAISGAGNALYVTGNTNDTVALEGQFTLVGPAANPDLNPGAVFDEYRAPDGSTVFVQSNIPVDVELSEAPSDIALDNTSVDENVDGAVIGTITVSDANTDETFTFATDDARFEVVGDAVNGYQLQLVSGTSLDAEAAASIDVEVTATDSAGLSTSETFTIAVTDADDNATTTPVDTSAAADAVAENAAAGTFAGITVSSTDADVTAGAISYAITGGTGQGLFEIDASGDVVVAQGAQIDFEQAQSLTIEVQATPANGTPSQTETFTIAVTDVNDSAPTLDQDSDSVVENSVGSIALSGSDADTTGEALSFTLASTGDATFFEIVNGNQLRFVSAPDFEAPADANGDNVYSVDVTVSDGSNATVETIDVTVTDEDEAPSVAALTGNADEDDTPVLATFDLLANATDPENGVLDARNLIQIAGPLVAASINASDELELDTSSSTLQDLAVGETVDIVFTFDVSDGTNDVSNTITVTVTGTNDEPQLDVAIADQSADEDATFSFTVPLGTFSDVDGDDLTLSATLANGDPLPSWLSFDAASRTFSGTPEQSDVGTLSVEVTATDPSGAEASDTFDLTVDAVDDAPVANDADFTADPASEDAVVDQRLGTDIPFAALATDPDSTIDAGSFSFDGASIGGQPVATLADAGISYDSQTGDFVLDPTNITAYQSLDDGETVDVVVGFTVTADGQSDQGSATFRIAGANDAPTVTGAVALTASDEDTTKIFTQTTLLANASDIDGDDLTVLNLALDTASAGAGTVTDNGDGSFTFMPAADFNGPVTFTYDVSDGDETVATTATLTVTAVNDAPVAGADQNVAVDENIDDTTIIATATANDVDMGDTVSFSITGGNSGGLFDIDAMSGDITLASGATLDAEQGTSYALEVTATDGANATDTQTIAIDVNDLDDNATTAPQDDNLAANEVDENAANGALVGLSVSSTDADVTAGDISYAITGGTGQGLFTVDANGEVRVAGSIDREAVGSSVTLEITATPANGAPSTASTFQIAVNDVDEFDVSPVTDADGDADAVTENAANGTTVGITASASDADATTNGVSYAITGGTGQGLFAIDANGVVTVADAIDREATGDTVTLEITASSADGSSSVETFSIGIDDVEEFDPTAPTDADTGDNTVSESAAAGTEVGITASSDDGDATDNVVGYAITGGSGQNLFDIDAAGVVTLNATGASTIDFETAQSYDIEVVANSSDGAQSTASTFTIAIGDENDTAPVITSAATLTQDENAQPSLALTASDADTTGEPITFSITGGADSGLFEIVNGNELRLVTAPDFENPADVGGDNVYDVEVTATDGTNPSAAQDIAFTVGNVNEAPVANDDALAAVENGSALVGNVVTSSDTDEDGDAVTVQDFTANGQTVAAGGTITLTNGATLSVASNGDVTLTQNGAYEALAVGQSAQAVFTYTATDGALTDDAAAVITIAGANDAPVANDDVATLDLRTDADGEITLGLQASDTDIDQGDMFDFSSIAGTAVTPGTSATIMLAGGGTLEYDGSVVTFVAGDDFDDVPDGQARVVSFSYEITDGQNATDTGSATVVVIGDNTAPAIDLDTGEAGVDYDAQGPAVSSTADANTPGALAIQTGDPNITDADGANDQIATITATIAAFDGTDGTNDTVDQQNGAGGSRGTLGLTTQGAMLAAALDATVTFANDVFTIDASGSPITQDQANRLLDEVRYANSETTFALDTDDRVIDVTVTDAGGATSAPATFTVPVSAVVVDTTGVNAFVGTDFDDTIDGRAGADTIEGRGGDDTLLGGDGDDTFVYRAGDGDDTVSGEAGTDDTLEVTATDSDEIVRIASTGAGEGTVTFDDDDVNTTDDPTITVDTLEVVDLDTGAGNDTVQANAFDDIVLEIDGGDGSDTLDTSLEAGAVTVDLDAGTFGLSATNPSANDVENVEDVTTGAGDDTVTGDAAANTLSTGAGNDRLTGGEGNDTLDGGVDTQGTAATAEGDVAAYAGNVAAAAITSDGNGNWTVDAGTDGTDTLVDVEIVEAANGRFLLVGNGGFDTIQAAVDEAVDGDTVLVAGGLYNEVVNIGAGIELRAETDGSGGYETVTLDGVVVDETAIEAATQVVTLRGLDVVSASGSDNQGIRFTDNTAGATDVASEGLLQVIDTTVSGFAGAGLSVGTPGNGAVPLTQIDVLVEGSTFEGNGTNKADGSNDINLGNFGGDATLRDVTVVNDGGDGPGPVATGFGNGTYPPYAIQISGVSGNSATNPDATVTEPIGAVVFDGVDVTGDYNNGIVVVQGYTDFDGLSFTDTLGGGLNITESSTYGYAVTIAADVATNFVPGTTTESEVDLGGVSIDADTIVTAFQIPGGPAVSVTGSQRAAIADTIEGSDYDNNALSEVLNGGLGSDTINGNAGADLVFGRGGNDVVDGGTGNDTIVEIIGEGSDTVEGGAHGATGDTFVLSNVGAQANPFFPGAANAAATTITVSADATAGDGIDVTANDGTVNETDDLTGVENLTVNLGAGGDTVTVNGGLAAEGLVTINVGTAPSSTSDSGAGADTFDVNALDDVTLDLDGADGTDTLDLTDVAGPVSVDLNAGEFGLTANGGDDNTVANVETVTGSGNDDTLVGSDNADTLNGGAGNDDLTGGAGDDTLDGGADSQGTAATAEGDAAIYDEVIDRSEIAANGTGGWTVTTDANGTDTLVDIEMVEFNDGTTSGRFLLVGNGGFDTLQAAVDESVDGDTILVTGGPYNEAVSVDVGVAIVGVDASRGVAVQSITLADAALDMASDTVSLENLTLGGAANAAGTRLSFQDADGDAAGTLSLTDVTVENATSKGLTVSSVSGLTDITVALADVDFSGNGASNGSGGADINLFNFAGDASFVDVDVAANAANNEHAIQIAGFTGNAAATGAIPGPIGNVRFDGVTVTGEAGKALVFINGYNDFSTLRFDQDVDGDSAADGLTIDGDAGWTGLFVDAQSAEGPFTNAAAPTTLNLTGVSVTAGNTFGGFGIAGNPGVFANGTPVADTITGTDVDNNETGDVLNGMGGDDEINAGAGADIVFGGAGDDDIDAGTGNDTIVELVGDGDDTIDGGANGAISGTNPGDTLIVSNIAPGATNADPPVASTDETAIVVTADATNGGFDVMTDGDAEADVTNVETVSVLLGNGGDTVTLSGDLFAQGVSTVAVGGQTVPDGMGGTITFGTAGDDTVNAAALANGTFVSASLGDGDDTFVAGAANANFNGDGNAAVDAQANTGGDTLDLSNTDEAVVTTISDTTGVFTNGDFGNLGYSGVENLVTGSAADDVTGSTDANIIETGTGDDVLTGGDGGDRLDGGAGDDDRVRYDRETGGGDTRVDLRTGMATDTFGDEDVLVDIENVTTGAGADAIATGAAENDVVAGAGDDAIGYNSDGSNDVVDGGDGADELVVQNGVVGTVSTGLFRTFSSTAATFDLAVTGTIASIGINGGRVDATNVERFDLGLGQGGDTIILDADVSGTAVDTIVVTGFSNAGGNGDDTVDATGFNGAVVSFNGAGGDDTLVVGTGGNQFFFQADDPSMGATDNDTVDFSNFTTDVSVDLGDGLTGQTATALASIAGVESVVGGSGSDSLEGSVDVNTLEGGAGDDTLTGEGGDDVLDGGEGTDTAVYVSDRGDFAITVDDNGTAGDLSDDTFAAIDDSGATNGTADAATDEGDDDLTDVEIAQFADVTLDLTKDVQVLAADGQLVGTFDLIQTAIDDAATLNGYTVRVSSTYAATESLTVSKELTLEGANRGLAGNDAARGAETVLTGTVTLANSNVTIRGFEFDTVGSSILGGANGSVNYSNITIEDNDFVGMDTASSSVILNGQGRGGEPLTGGANWTIDDNRFDGITGSDSTAIRIDNVNGVTITNNEILHDDASAGFRRGIQIDNSQSVVVNDNTLAMGADASAGDTSVAAAAVYGVRIGSDQDGSTVGMDDVGINGNTISGAFAGIATSDEGRINDLDIIGNDIDEVVFGVVLSAGGPTTSPGTQSDLVITGNTFGVDVSGAALSVESDTGDDGYDTVDFSGNTFAGTYPGVAHTGTEDTFDLIGDSTFVGSDGDDELFGGTGADTLTGNGGDDLVIGLGGADTLSGGEGDDTFRYFSGDGGDTINGGEGPEANGDLLEIEAIAAVGSADDVTFGASATADGTVDVNGGVSSFSNLERIEVATGDGDDDIEFETVIDPADTMVTVDAGGGSTVAFTNTAVTAFGDTLTFQTVPATGTAGEGVTVDLAAGTFTMTGLTGSHTIVAGVSGDAGSSIETVVGSLGDDGITGDDQSNILNGNDGADTLSGRDGADLLIGGAGADTIFGGSGDDVIIGGADDDLLNGDAGADTFVYLGGNEGLDRITNFNSGLAGSNTTVDQFLFDSSSADYASLAGGASFDVLVRDVTNNSYTGNTTSPTFVIDTQTGPGQDDFVLYFDEDGDGTIEKAVTEIDTASNVSDLGTEDFTIV